MQTSRATRVALGLTCASLLVGGALLHRAARARTTRAERDYGALRACLLGGRVPQPETVQGRLLALETSLAVPGEEGLTALERGWPGSCQPLADALSRTLIVGVPSSPAARGLGLIAALEQPIVPRETDACVSQPCKGPSGGGAHPESQPLAGSASAAALLVWWQSVVTAASAAGIYAADDESFARPRVRRAGLNGPFPEPIAIPPGPVEVVSRSGPGPGAAQGKTLLWTFQHGGFRVVRAPSDERFGVVGAEDFAPSLLRRGLSEEDTLRDEAGIEIVPFPLRASSGFATITGAALVRCEGAHDCWFGQYRRRGDRYVSEEWTTLPGAREAALPGGVIVFRERASEAVYLGSPRVGLGKPTELRASVSSIASARTCRHDDRTTLLFPDGQNATLAAHDGQAWGKPLRFELVRAQAGREPVFSCDKLGANLVVVDEQRRVCTTRCLSESCTTACSQPVSEGWRLASWIGIGDHVFAVQADVSTKNHRARDSVWYRFGTTDDLGEDKLLAGDEAHGGFLARTALAWPVEAGALVLLQEVYTPNARVVQIDASGRPSFPKQR